MSKRIIQLNEAAIKDELKELVRGSVEKEAQALTQAARYERTEARQGYRSGHYTRNLTTTSGEVTLKMPRLKGVSFESVRRVEGIPQALWDTKVSPATVSELNKKAYVPSKNGGIAPCGAVNTLMCMWTVSICGATGEGSLRA